ncbi:MAG: hypothetical protein ACLFPE_09980 [Bacteroidales bacterium]
MKKFRLLAFVLITGLLAGCAGESENSAKEEPQVKVPQTTSTTTKKPATPQPQLDRDAKPGYASKLERGQKRRESIEDTYDAQGNLIERRDKMFDKYGNVSKKNRYTYKYDDAGRRIEQWYFANTANDEPIMSSVNYITYDDKGRKVENIFISYDAYDNEVRWAKNEYKHNSQGRVTEDITLNKQGIPLSKTIYNYEDGMLVSENFVKYDEQGNPTGKQTLKYNEYGKVIETIKE